MKPIIKEMLLEWMHFFNKRRDASHYKIIKNALSNMDNPDYYVRASQLLGWLNPKDDHGDQDKNRFQIYNREVMELENFQRVYLTYQNIFKYTPEVQDIFVLKEEHIVFNPSLNQGDIQELYDFVETNYVVDPRRITFYIDHLKNKGS